MQILAKPTPPTMPPAMRLRTEVQTLIRAPRQIADGLFRAWSANYDLLWTPVDGVTPADRIAALGPLAGEMMTASSALCQFMLQVIGNSDPEMTAAIQTRLAAMPAYTIHEDGTVTLD